jgi:hypothetical protein
VNRRTSGRLGLGLCLLSVALTALALWVWLLRGAGDYLGGPVATALGIALGMPFALVGALIFANRPGNRIGRLLLALALMFSGWQLALSLLPTRVSTTCGRVSSCSPGWRVGCGRRS